MRNVHDMYFKTTKVLCVCMACVYESRRLLPGRRYLFTKSCVHTRFMVHVVLHRCTHTKQRWYNEQMVVLVVVVPHNMRDEWMECARRRPVIESVCVRRPAGAVADATERGAG